MAQQDQIIINMSQVNQDQKQRLLKVFPKKLLLTFSFLQLVFGFSAILFQVSLIILCSLYQCNLIFYTSRLLESYFMEGPIGMVLCMLDGVYG